MHEEDISKVMNLVFQYLKPPDLAIAAQVSSTWYRIAKHESIGRNTYFYILDKVIRNFVLRLIFKNMSIKVHFNFIPSFGIRFYNANIDVNVNHECNCRNRQFCGSIINIKSNCNMDILRGVDFLYWFLFPINDFTEVTILSIINRSIANENLCRSVFFDTDDKEQTVSILNNIDTFFTQNSIRSSVLIIFCQTTSLRRLLRAYDSFYVWIGDHKITIWLAIVDELSFCRYNFGQHDCRIDTEFIFMFIYNSSMKSYTCQLSVESSTAEDIRSELLLFKEENELLLRSIAFMHIPYIRIIAGLYELYTSVFKEVFPNVDLYPYYGTGSFVCSCLEDFFTQSGLNINEGIHQTTSILIITHD